MNRRNFLKTGSLAMVAAAGLPQALKAGNVQEPLLTYRSRFEPGVAGQWVYELKIDHAVIEDFKNASDVAKTLLLKKVYFATTDINKPSQEADYGFVMKKVSASKESLPEYEVTTKFDKKMSTNEDLDKRFLKTPKFYIKKLQYVEIRDKSGDRLQNLLYVPPKSSSSSSGSSDCFLTTACVEHKRMADNCEALETLRSLRNEFMTKNSEGRKLIEQYQTSGPAIVQAIGLCQNKEQIYDYMFEHMIQPSVVLVKEGKFEEAVEYYRVFVKALHQQYN